MKIFHNPIKNERIRTATGMLGNAIQLATLLLNLYILAKLK